MQSLVELNYTEMHGTGVKIIEGELGFEVRKVKVHKMAVWGRDTS